MMRKLDDNANPCHLLLRLPCLRDYLYQERNSTRRKERPGPFPARERIPLGVATASPPGADPSRPIRSSRPLRYEPFPTVGAAPRRAAPPLA